MIQPIAPLLGIRALEPGSRFHQALGPVNDLEQHIYTNDALITLLMF